MTKRIVLYCFVGLFFVKTYAQSEAESSQIKSVEQNLTAPNTASLGRYFDIPVNMATGVSTPFLRQINLECFC